MKKNNFITKYDDSVLNGTFEVFTKPSKTEPDNAMSIPEIIARFTRGYGIEVQQHDWTQGTAPDVDQEGWEDILPESELGALTAQEQQAILAMRQAAQQQQQQQQQQPAAEPAAADPAAKPAPEA